MRVEIEHVSASLRAPFVSASGSVERRELLLLRLEDPQGNVGFGEAGPLENYDGVGIEDCRGALEDCRGVLLDSDGSEREWLLAECRRLAVLPQAVAAVDVALWDLAGKRAAQPVSQLLNAPGEGSIEVNYTVSSPDRAGAAGEAAAARRAGYRVLKLKVGTGDDAGRLAAVRAAVGPEMAIRLDANGAWTVADAAAALRALAPVGIELCEEPVGSVEEMVALSEYTEVPLAIDESSVDPRALERRVCAALCLKVSRGGGISGLLEVGRQARDAGYELYLASSLDGPLGIAAALHAAAALGPDRACGLATLQLFADRADPLAPIQGRIPVPQGPGLGDGLMGWYSW